MDLADLLCDVLADENTRLRQQFPDVFVLVDRIKATPGRHASHVVQYVNTSMWCWVECAWCGEDFVTSTRRPAQHCSPRCVWDGTAWQRNRAA